MRKEHIWHVAASSSFEKTKQQQAHSNGSTDPRATPHTQRAPFIKNGQELAMDYRSQMIIRQKETQEQAAGMDRQTMALHHAEQEIVRLQSLLGTVAKIAPSVCKVVHKAAPDFDFLERGFTVRVRMRAVWLPPPLFLLFWRPLAGSRIPHCEE